ncbi:hypothetical protein BDN72DRAFT_855267 [Pluteus cervinus]|uniref:Uncharacterized protein n=1 Tax=Pluteus cervinus TaxID=181527 RepID=A0ACD3B4K4_9AGAR|nr:hypothetical protein BDN72DRAFT_855267 [Pluteus cervinus]
MSPPDPKSLLRNPPDKPNYRYCSKPKLVLPMSNTRNNRTPKAHQSIINWGPRRRIVDHGSASSIQVSSPVNVKEGCLESMSIPTEAVEHDSELLGESDGSVYWACCPSSMVNGPIIDPSSDGNKGWGGAPRRAFIVEISSRTPHPKIVNYRQHAGRVTLQ